MAVFMLAWGSGASLLVPDFSSTEYAHVCTLASWYACGDKKGPGLHSLDDSLALIMHWFTITDTTVSEHFQTTQEVLLTPTIFFMKSLYSRHTFRLSRLRTIHTCPRIFFHSLTAPNFSSSGCGSGHCANDSVWLEVIDSWLGQENENRSQVQE